MIEAEKLTKELFKLFIENKESKMFSERIIERISETEFLF